MNASTLKLVVLSLLTIIIWYLARQTLFTPFYDYEYTDGELSFNHPLSLDDIKNALDKAYISVHEVLAKTESAKSIIELEEGLRFLKEAIKERNILAGEKPDRLPKVDIPKTPSIDASKEICPEKHGGRRYDYPFFLKNIQLDPDCKAPPLKDLVTVVFNFVNEIPISKAATLFEDIAFCMYKDMTFIAFVLTESKEIPKLKSIAKEKLPNMHIIERKQTESAHGAVLHEAVSEVKTKYVVMTRNTERFDNFTAIVRLVRDISLGKVTVIGGSHRNTSGHWKAGCFQMKMVRGEMGIDEGYDLSDNGCMFCDYMSGPFAVRKDVFLNYLSNHKTSKLSKDFFYMQFFMHVRLQMQKRMYMCIDSMFYTETSGLILSDKNSWLPFQSEMKISKITFPDHKTSYEFKCDEVHLSCVPEQGKSLPFCCYNTAEHILKAVIKFLKEKNLQFRFHLPGVTKDFEHDGNIKKSTIVVGISKLDSLNELEIKGFSWNSQTDVLSAEEWRLIFVKDTNTPKEPVNIRFKSLLLPVNGDPGKTLVEKDKNKCSRNNICFDLLHEYNTLDSQRVWL